MKTVAGSRLNEKFFLTGRDAFHRVPRCPGQSRTRCNASLPGLGSAALAVPLIFLLVPGAPAQQSTNQIPPGERMSIVEIGPHHRRWATTNTLASVPSGGV
jgi:hypothetical protein